MRERADPLTPTERSERMRKIRSRDTKPEQIVRSETHRMGFRYRLHDGNLPGRPDIVFPSKKRAIFVHGCFWHLHRCCVRANVPQSRVDYWRPKLVQNKSRDRAAVAALRRGGWRVLVVWECEMKDREELRTKLRAFIEGTDEK